MHRKRSSLVIIVILIVLGLVNSISIEYDTGYPFAMVLGVPVISEEYSDFSRLSVDQILFDGDHLYVLYGEHKGIIQVFNAKGEYRYTVSFFDHLNGAFSMAVQEGVLYVRDSIHNIYVLRDGLFEGFIKREDATDLANSLDFTLHSADYRLRYGSIWYISDNQKYCVVQRPIFAALYQDNLLFFVIIIIVLLSTAREYFIDNMNEHDYSKKESGNLE